MSEQSRNPTDEARTEIYDPERPRAPVVASAAPGSASSSSASADARRRPAPSTLPAPAGPPPPKLPSPELSLAGRAAAPQARPAPLTPLFEALEDPTDVTPFPVKPPVELATPTQIDPGPGPGPGPGAGPGPGGGGAAEAVVAERKRGLERSEPIRVISMKDQAAAEKPRREEHRVPLHVQLRSMAEVAGHGAPRELGRLAPPRDPQQARARHRRANVLWACVAIGLAAAIMLVIWLVAGR